MAHVPHTSQQPWIGQEGWHRHRTVLSHRWILIFQHHEYLYIFLHKQHPMSTIPSKQPVKLTALPTVTHVLAAAFAPPDFSTELEQLCQLPPLANEFGNRLLSSLSSPCLTCVIYVVWNTLETGPIWRVYFFLSIHKIRNLCGMFWLGRLGDAGKDEGLAPSMWSLVCFVHFDWKCASRHNGVQLLISHLSAPAALASLLFNPPSRKSLEKHKVLRLCYLFAQLHLLFSAFSSLLISDFLFRLSSLSRPISVFHLSILSAVWLLNFLR